MNKKIIISAVTVITLMLVSIISINAFKSNSKINTQKMDVTVLSAANDKVTVQDKDNIIYTFNMEDPDIQVGSFVAIEYTGVIDKNKVLQSGNIISYTTAKTMKNSDGVPTSWLDNGIFSNFYILANNKLNELTLDEKIGQLLLVRYPDNNQIEELQKYKFGGYLFFEKDFRDKTSQEVKTMMKNLQKAANIPILTATDEEGGRVVRVSSNPNLATEKFKSPSELYNNGGLEAIKNDTLKKSEVLNNIGINLNLAPVVDVSTNPSDYMYDRTIGQNTQITSDFAKIVIEASKKGEVSYTLKHFPGYGNNSDTHTGSSTDNRTLDDIKNNDLPPFKSGIEAGAEAVLVSHNTVTSIDSSNPASLSSGVHNLLRSDLGFTGIIITDDLDMGAVSNVSNAVVKAILAGNDLIITTNYKDDIESIKNALNNGTISEEQIDKLAFRVLAWKYYKGLMFDEQK